MNYRLATIMARLAVAADYTETIDLNLTDPVSQFHILYESTGVGAGSADHHAAKCITKIELVDGSDVLCSLSGQEAQALDFYHRKVEPANLSNYLSAQNAEMVFNINFGRHLWDPLLAFDPRKFTNPQLKITMNRSAGGVSSVAGFLTVLANIFDGKAVDPTGFFMQKEIKEYGLGDGTHEYTSMPTDYPYRKLLIFAQTEAHAMDWLLTNIKLSENNDKKIPFDTTLYNYMRAVVGLLPPYREHLIISGGATTMTFYCTPCYWPRVQAASWEVSQVPYTQTAMGGDGGKGNVYLESAAGNCDVEVEGWCPHGAIEIPFGLQDDPADWYNVTELGSLMLDIVSGGGRTTADKVQIVLQQLRNYA